MTIATHVCGLHMGKLHTDDLIVAGPLARSGPGRILVSRAGAAAVVLWTDGSLGVIAASTAGGEEAEALRSVRGPASHG